MCPWQLGGAYRQRVSDTLPGVDVWAKGADIRAESVDVWAMGVDIRANSVDIHMGQG